MQNGLIKTKPEINWNKKTEIMFSQMVHDDKEPTRQ